MDGRTTAKEIGTRIRKFRMLKGWSQKELGDKIQTTSAAVSKYEKEGVHDIEVIQELSNALEVDLLKDEMDVEGEVGEIGLEILSLMLPVYEDFEDDEGYMPISYLSRGDIAGEIDFEDLFSGDNLFGLSKDRVLHELSKLENLGLCVREQFVDYDGDNRDIVFITAKGIIAVKRRIPDFAMPENLKSYEMLCENYSSVQEYIDSSVIHKEIENLDLNSAFRYNFFAFMARSLANRDFSENKTFHNSYFIGLNCYADILYSMMLEMSRADADRLALDKVEFEEEEALSKLASPDDDYIDYILNCDPDHCRDFTEDLFISYLGNRVNKKYYIPANEKEHKKMQRALSEEEKRLKALLEPKIEEQDEFFEKYNNRVKEIGEDGKKVDVRKLFSKDKIETWVKSNILSPDGDDEKAKQLLMEKWLNEYYTAREYFRFPDEWEKNGLADVVRDAYGISDIMMKHIGETYEDNIDDCNIMSTSWTSIFYE